MLNGFAEDLLKILDSKLVDQKYWNSGTRHTLMRDRTQTTALALWSYAKLRRDSPVTAGIANHLLAESSRLQSNNSLGFVVAGLSEYYDRGERPGDDYEVDIFVNDKLAQRVQGKANDKNLGKSSL